MNVLQLALQCAHKMDIDEVAIVRIRIDHADNFLIFTYVPP